MAGRNRGLQSCKPSSEISCESSASARCEGENLVRRSQCMPWYQGPSLLEYLETVEVAPTVPAEGFRMPVQCVNRPNATFRGYCGLITSGEVHVGMPVQILPSGQCTHVERIVTADGDLTHALACQSVTPTLSDDVDVSRGDVVSDCALPPAVADWFDARLVWIGPDVFVPGRPYLIKLASVTATAAIERPLYVVDLETNRSAVADSLVPNDIGMAIVRLDRMIATDHYSDFRDTGSFIIVDSETCDTVALGIIEAVESSALGTGKTNLLHLIRSSESHVRSFAKAVSWRATGSLDTFLIAARITGNLKLAGGVALSEVVTKTALYYLHERAWALIPWGRSSGHSVTCTAATREPGREPVPQVRARGSVLRVQAEHKLPMVRSI